MTQFDLHYRIAWCVKAFVAVFLNVKFGHLYLLYPKLNHAHSFAPRMTIG